MPSLFNAPARIVFLLGFALTLALLPCAFGREQRVSASSPSSNILVARVHLRDEDELRRFVSLGPDLLGRREGDDLFTLPDPKQLRELPPQGWQEGDEH